jgi:uncharacterized lipoprotein YmbA
VHAGSKGTGADAKGTWGLSEAKAEHNKTPLEREIETTNRQIDEPVNEVYGLAKEEARILEEASKWL